MMHPSVSTTNLGLSIRVFIKVSMCHHRFSTFDVTVLGLNKAVPLQLCLQLPGRLWETKWPMTDHLLTEDCVSMSYCTLNS